MSKPLRLTLNIVKCLREQAGEPGKDEMYLIAFGITGGGHRLYVPPTSLGSYGTGDNKTVNKTLLDETVNDGETLAALCFWLFERDSGVLATSAGAILSDFHASVGNYLALDASMGLPPDARHCYAFAQSMVNIRRTLDLKAVSWTNDDELFMPRFHHLRAALPHPGPGPTNRFTLQMGADGLYELTFDVQFRLEPVVMG